MPRPRITPGALCALILITALFSCRARRGGPDPDVERAHIVDGRGADTEAARALSKGKLVEMLRTRRGAAVTRAGARGLDAHFDDETPDGEEREERASRQPPPGRAAPATPSASPVATPDAVGVDYRGLGDASPGARSEEPAPEMVDMIRARAEKKAAETTAAPPKTWKRSAHCPTFARVYVGGGNSLELKRMRVTMHTDGPRARTIVDHVFYNPHDKALEGSFEYPLPPNASVSYFAMFLAPGREEAPAFFEPPVAGAPALPAHVLADLRPGAVTRRVSKPAWGELREARVVHREKARRTYEKIVRRKIDPALLEYAGPNMFRGRVFPIPAKGFNRVIIAYEQHLDVAGGTMQYRFPLPDCPLALFHLTATVPSHQVRTVSFDPAEGGAMRRERDKFVFDLAYERTNGPGGEARIEIVPKERDVQFVTGADPTAPGQHVTYARLRPDLPSKVAAAWAKRAVFALDTSFSEAPDRFNTSRALIERILEKDPAIERFNVLCFDIGASWIAPGGWIENTAEGRARAFAALDDVLLEGATDFGAAVAKLAETRWDPARERVNLFVLTDGRVCWGERASDRLAAELAALPSMETRVFCYRTGIGGENLALFRDLTRRGGAIFNVFDEGMADRAALAHRRPCFVVEGIEVEGSGDAPATVSDLLVAGRQASIYPEGELVVAWRERGAPVRRVTVRGRIDGIERTLAFDLGDEAAGARASQLAARAWAGLAVEQLLATGEPDHERLAVAYAQHFRIATPVTSFLVLETDAEYEMHGIEEEAKRLEKRDIATAVKRHYDELARPIARKAAFERFLDRVAARTGLAGAGADTVRAIASSLTEDDFGLPAIASPVTVPRRDAASPEYLAARAEARDDAHVYLDEAARRAKATRDGAAYGALRALSTIVELNPTRSDALRVVGYRLLAMDQPEYAVGLFDRVRQNRPFEPHSYLDLARSLEVGERWGLAAIYYEVVLAGAWDERFKSLKAVAREAYHRMLRRALRAGMTGPLRERFGDRIETFGTHAVTGDLVVTISWNTDDTDVDLWVVDPTGEACGYDHKLTAAGGKLLDDLTQGYGPERFMIEKGPPGEYEVLVHYYGDDDKALARETHVEVVVTRRAGHADEEVRRFQVVLTREKEAIEVCRVRL